MDIQPWKYRYSRIIDIGFVDFKIFYGCWNFIFARLDKMSRRAPLGLVSDLFGFLGASYGMVHMTGS